MGVLKLIMTIALVLVSLVLIIAVVLQESSSSGISSVTGSETLFGSKGKSKGKQAKLAKITTIAGGIFMVICVAMAIIKF